MKVWKKGFCILLAALLVCENADTSGMVTVKADTTYGEDGTEYQSGSAYTTIDKYFSVVSATGELHRYTGTEEKVVIPDSIKSIGESAFELNSTLKEVVLPNSITKIGRNAFNSCANLETITIPNSVTKIEEGAFRKCAKLKRIVIPENVKTIKRRTFEDCTLLEEIVIENGTETIEEYAFYQCTSLKNIVIPESVKSIKNWAFEECSGLKDVTIPKGVTSLEDALFKGCTSLENIILPDTVTVINQEVFSGCTSLSEVQLPNSITEIGDSAFEGCTNLKKVVIPEKITMIARKTFYGCSNLQEITFPKELHRIQYDAFSKCENIEKVAIDSENEEYCVDEGGSFYLRSKVDGKEYKDLLWISPDVEHYVCLPDDGLMLIGYVEDKQKYDVEREEIFSHNPFSFTSKLKTITFTTGRYLDGFAINDCKSLEKVIADKENPYYITDEAGALYNKERKSLVFVPKNITNYEVKYGTQIIEPFAFQHCNNLLSVTVPDTIVNIEYYEDDEIEYMPFKEITTYSNGSLNICGYETTEIETYAQKNNMNFSALPQDYEFNKDNEVSRTFLGIEQNADSSEKTDEETQTNAPEATNVPKESMLPGSTPVPTEKPTFTEKPVFTEKPSPVIEPENQKLVLYAGGNTQNNKKYDIKVSGWDHYSISYESTDPSVATVSKDGKITAVKAGTAKITAKIKEEDNGTEYPFVLVNVTVKKAGLFFEKKISSLQVKKKVALKVKKNGIKGTIQWKVSNKKYASVDKKGILKAKKAGTVKVTALCGKAKATITVKIKK